MHPMIRHSARLRGALPGVLVALLFVLTVPTTAAGNAAEAAATESPQLTATVRIDAENWRWIPDTIRVAKGTQVTLEIRNFDATHRFDLKQFGLKVPLPQDKTTVIEFLADKVGTFTWKCGRPCGNGCPKMRGKLTVYDPAN